MADRACQVFEIIRGSTHDGPGIRTVVFFQGCPLRCAWCQNPEGIAGQPDVWWDDRKCIGCRACIEACTAGALTAKSDGVCRDRRRCTRCGACVQACPARAMTVTARAWSMDALVTETLKDRAYYQAFGGGVTASGGEPLRQYRAVAAWFRHMRQAGVHTALDTCGWAPAAAFDAVLPHTDHVLFDLKVLDPDRHRSHTGRTNRTILERVMMIADRIRNGQTGLTLWIRTPLIPDATATPENLAAIGRFIRERLADGVARWELCAFNNACADKYRKLGREWHHAQQPLLRQSQVDRLMDAALSTGPDAARVAVSGLIAKG